MDSNSSIPLKSCLKASQIRKIEGKTIGKDGKPMCAIRKPVRVISSCDENPNVAGDSSLKDKTSQSVNVTKEAGETSLNDFELRNEVSVEGAAVAIPYEANGKRIAQFESKEGMDKVLENGPWLIQTVPLILNVWSLNTDLKKAEVKKTSVWIKLHHLPIVTYSEGKSTYARALIEVSAENELFGIFDKCPKLPKEVPAAKVEMRALLSKKRNHQEKKSSKTKQIHVLDEEGKEDEMYSDAILQTNDVLNVSDNEVDEVILVETRGATWNIRGLNFFPKQNEVRHIIFEYNLSICVILESHVADSNLHRLCSLVFRHWDWASNGAWCRKGNFNAALFIDDSTASGSNVDIAMREFRDCIEDIEVLDVQCTGLQYTWNQKPKGMNGMLKKLDRVMANIEFNDHFVGAHAIFKPYRISDHSPSVLCIPMLSRVKPRPFKFFNILTTHEKFLDVVKGNWEQQTLLDADPFNAILREREASCVVEFNEAVLLEERFLKQKAKIQWLKEEGVVFENDMVPNAFIAHYESFLGLAGETYGFNVINLFNSCLNEQEANDMVRNVTAQEVKEAFFSIGDDKSPGPDGYTAAFFKEAWNVVANDVTNVICEFFRNGTLLKELNHTIIALIPKVKNPTRVVDYRPISCCNVLFKCISKIIANRIKHSLMTLVSPNQSAFIPGRSITDNILLTQELMHNYHLDQGTPRCAFKVDIQKAYDTVDWNFLRLVLYGFGFHERMIAWIMECVTSTSYSICVHGSLHGYFQGKRGLRQGDPLSPYLFTLVMEVLTLMIKRKVQESDLFTYHRFCSKMELINLCFADDLFLFAYGDVQSASVIKEALDEFKQASGLIPSLPKSTTYFCNVLNHVKLSILQVLLFEEGKLPVKYLGVPLVSSRLMIRDCNKLIDRVQIRIQD
ncbi:hypothetical protein Tco_0066029 [Tanacetum coccineum]